MQIELRGVSKGAAGHALPRTSLTYESGWVTLAAAETELRPTVLGLVASGRMTVDTGSVTIDGRPDPKGIRTAVALVDAPVVSEPPSSVTVAGVAAEELMFAGRPSGPSAVRRYLESAGLAEQARTTMADVGADTRIRMLCEFALLREGVRGLVLAAPDRHGGHPSDWWRIAEDIAARDVAVLVIAGTAAAAALAAAGVDLHPGPTPGVETDAEQEVTE